MPPPLQPPPDSGHREAETEQYLPSDIDKCRKLVSSKIRHAGLALSENSPDEIQDWFFRRAVKDLL
jgi:hypothetical protein